MEDWRLKFGLFLVTVFDLEAGFREPLLPGRRDFMGTHFDVLPLRTTETQVGVAGMLGAVQFAAESL